MRHPESHPESSMTQCHIQLAKLAHKLTLLHFRSRDTRRFQKLESRIHASLSRQPLVKGERLVRDEVNAAINYTKKTQHLPILCIVGRCFFAQ